MNTEVLQWVTSEGEHYNWRVGAQPFYVKCLGWLFILLKGALIYACDPQFNQRTPLCVSCTPRHQLTHFFLCFPFCWLCILGSFFSKTKPKPVEKQQSNVLWLNWSHIQNVRHFWTKHEISLKFWHTRNEKRPLLLTKMIKLAFNLLRTSVLIVMLILMHIVVSYMHSEFDWLKNFVFRWLPWSKVFMDWCLVLSQYFQRPLDILFTLKSRTLSRST